MTVMVNTDGPFRCGPTELGYCVETSVRPSPERQQCSPPTTDNEFLDFG